MPMPPKGLAYDHFLVDSQSFKEMPLFPLFFFGGGDGVLHPNICDFGMVPPKFNIDTQNCDMFQRRCIFQTILFGIFANFWGVFLTKSQQNWLFENMLLPTEVIFKFA